jgi:hypothetical protein
MPHHDTLEAQGDPFDIDVGDEDDDEPEEDQDDEDEEEEGEWQVDGRCARLDFARLKSL